jgi:undecaprenyl-diphosphatase
MFLLEASGAIAGATQGGPLSYAEAIVIGVIQGVTELFPVSSLGHAVLIPALLGGSWASDLNVSAPESPYLAFIVGLHVATALALLLFFWRDWLRIVKGFFSSVRHRRVRTAEERLAWLLILATIPVGISGLLLEHLFRTVLGRPEPAAAFLIANGVMLLLGERLRRKAPVDVAPESVPVSVAGGPAPVTAAMAAGDEYDEHREDLRSDVRLSRMRWGQGILVGCAQILALLPGISRSGASMVAGLAQGLSHRDAARFSFLLATPVILAAGVLKVPDLFGPLGDGIRGQILAGSVAAFVAAYLSVRFLEKYFRTKTLIPFGIYSIVAGSVALTILLAR